MKKRFSDIQVGDIVYYVHPRHDYFEICDLEFVEKKSDSEYKFHRKIATDYVEYNMEINTERIYTSSVYGKNKPFALFADKEEFLNCLKSLNQMIKEKITYYERRRTQSNSYPRRDESEQVVATRQRRAEPSRSSCQSGGLATCREK